MKQWILSVTAGCLILSVAGLILNDGKTKKYISGILRMVVITLVFLPIVRFFIKNDDLWKNFDAISEVSLKKETVENSFLIRLIEKELNEKNIDCSVKLTLEKDSNEYLDIFINDKVINEKEGNIYKNSKTIIETVEKYLAIERERIRVWVN